MSAELEIKHDLDIEATLALMEEQLIEPKSDDRVIVQVHLPHVTDYNPTFDPMRDLVYRWGGPGEIAVGDLVLCPPTPKLHSVFTGIVVALGAEGHPYQGPCKTLLGKVENG